MIYEKPRFVPTGIENWGKLEIAVEHSRKGWTLKILHLVYQRREVFSANIPTLPTNYILFFNSDCTVAELVNPRKSHFEVLLDSQNSHDMYMKSHNDYNPSERVDRGYDLFICSW